MWEDCLFLGRHLQLDLYLGFGLIASHDDDAKAVSTISASSLSALLSLELSSLHTTIGSCRSLNCSDGSYDSRECGVDVILISRINVLWTNTVEGVSWRLHGYDES